MSSHFVLLYYHLYNECLLFFTFFHPSIIILLLRCLSVDKLLSRYCIFEGTTSYTSYNSPHTTHLLSNNTHNIISLFLKQVFTSAKDVSESMAAIQAAGQYGLKSLQIKQKSDNNSKNNGQSSHNNSNSSSIRVKCLCIGDGSTPRTAVLA